MKFKILGLSITCAFITSVQAANLYDFYQLAINSDPTFQLADKERTLAKERHTQAKADNNFSATFDANYFQTWDKKFEDTGDSSGYNLALNYPIYNRGLGLSINQALQNIDKAEVTYISAMQELMLRVSERYFAVLNAIDTLDFSRATKAALSKQYEQSRQRFEVGLIAITDVQESKAGFDLATANEIRDQNSLDNAYEALREVIGEYRKDLSRLKDDIPLVSPEPNNVEQWVEGALKDSPKIIALQHEIEIAQRGIELARSTYYPTVNATAKNSYFDQGENLTKRSGGQNMIGLSLNVPLDIGGKIKAQVQTSQTQYTQALDRLEQQKRQTQKTVRQSFLSVLSDIGQVKATKQALVSNETAFKATQTGYEVGTRTSVDVFNARQRLLEAQRNYAQARYNYVLDTLKLKQAAGLLNENDFVKLKEWFTDQDQPIKVDAKKEDVK
jgi:outer membrane protein